MADDALSRLTQDEKTTLAALLKRTIADDRYPLSPRIGTLRGHSGKATAAEAGAGSGTAAEGICPSARHSKAAASAGMMGRTESGLAAVLRQVLVRPVIEDTGEAA